MSQRTGNKKASDISSLLEKILIDKGLDKKLQQYRAWTIWDDVVGPQIAQYAQPLRIRESILEVRVAHATWMQQLQLLKPKILKELNTRLGENSLVDIYWKRGEIDKSGPEGSPEPSQPLPDLTDKQSSEIDLLTGDISDKELQLRLKNLLTIAGRHDRESRTD